MYFSWSKTSLKNLPYMSVDLDAPVISLQDTHATGCVNRGVFGDYRAGSTLSMYHIEISPTDARWRFGV